ncbi:MAG: cellulase family glycosylhydrolase [Bacillota bacterium]
MRFLKRFALFALVLAVALVVGGCFSVTQQPVAEPVQEEAISRAPSSSGILGANNPHIWFDSQAYTALDAIKSNGFNTVRIVWQTNGSGSRLKQIIDRCKALGLKPIPELHDVTGGTSSSDIDRMVNYWISNKSYIASDVWINIANEWGPRDSPVWRDTYKSAIQKMRSNGISNVLVIDAGGWGQDDQNIRKYAKELLGVDSNLMFSIHMYGEWNDNNKINDFLTYCKNNGIPIMVGEFGYNYNNGNNNLGCKVDAAYLIQRCKELGIGYIGWSWCGNNSENAWLDMTNDWKTLNYWGNLVRYGGSSSSGGSSSGTTVLANFENTTEGWQGSNIAGGPWSVTEWKYNGSYSLKADVDLSGGKQIYLYKSGSTNFSGKSRLKAVVCRASWGTYGSGMQAKLYVKTGSNWQWYDSGAVTIGTSATTLTLNLSGVSNLGDVREYGIQYICGSNSSGRSAVYVDYVTLE